MLSSTGLQKEQKGNELSSPTVVRAFERLKEFAERNPATNEAIQVALGRLVDAGVTSDEIFSALGSNDFEQITQLSVPVSRAAFQAAHQISEVPVGEKARPSALRAQVMSLEALVRGYDPLDIGSAIHKELAARLKLNPNEISSPKVFEFTTEGHVDVQSTLARIRALLTGENEAFDVQDRIQGKRAFGIGELPNIVVGIQPITREPLFSNGNDRDGLNWKGRDIECQQLLYLAGETGELRASLSRPDTLRLFRLCQSKDGMDELMFEFPKAAQRFNECKVVGGLPTLLTLKSSVDSKRDQTDPVEITRDRLRGTLY